MLLVSYLPGLDIAPRGYSFVLIKVANEPGPARRKAFGSQSLIGVRKLNGHDLSTTGLCRNYLWCLWCAAGRNYYTKFFQFVLKGFCIFHYKWGACFFPVWLITYYASLLHLNFFKFLLKIFYFILREVNIIIISIILCLQACCLCRRSFARFLLILFNRIIIFFYVPFIPFNLFENF